MTRSRSVPRHDRFERKNKKTDLERRKMMEYRKMEKLGISTSLLGFGCMRFPTNADGSIDEKEALARLIQRISRALHILIQPIPIMAVRARR